MIKYILIWLFIFIVGSLIVNFIINPSSFESFKENIKEKISEVKISNLKNLKEEIDFSILDTYCEKNIIPNSFIIWKDSYWNQIISDINRDSWKYSGAVILLDPVWKDETKFGVSTGRDQFTNSYDCRMGEFEGENKNYLYCFNIGYSKEVKDIDPQGDILDIKNYNYRIDLVIDVQNQASSEIISRTNVYGTESIELNSYLIVDYKCEKNQNDNKK